ncbi:MAG: heavy-metal-associated domain-containing protein [Synechococcaceae cyanobacterium RL_1_2]|nr:heavy-metal-associated domain-containing protein [Synechococcaceae cyanobacterium RL_1_2]
MANPTYFHIKGMGCVSCAQKIEQVLGKVAGIEDCQVSYALNEGVINFDPQRLTSAEIAQKIKALGYDAIAVEQNDPLGNFLSSEEGIDQALKHQLILLRSRVEF